MDAEGLLRHAVDVFRKADPADRSRCGKRVLRLAKRLHTARVRFLRAQLAAASDPATATVLERNAVHLVRLEEALSREQSDGFADILREFAVEDVLGSSVPSRAPR